MENTWPRKYMEEDSDDERRTNFWRLHVGNGATERGSLMKGRRKMIGVENPEFVEKELFELAL